MEEIVKLKEIIQVGDTFLVKYNCPNCNQEQFDAVPLSKCSTCLKDLSLLELKLTKMKRLLSGTRRKKLITKRMVQTLMLINGNNCAYCSISFEGSVFHIEHIFPLAAGGTNNLDNLCLACPKCNLIAGSKYFNSFIAKKRFILTQRKILC